MKNSTKDIVHDLSLRYPPLAVIEENIAAAVEILINSYKNGGKLLICGNGGSASDSLHIVGELMKDFAIPRPLSDEQKKSV